MSENYTSGNAHVIQGDHALKCSECREVFLNFDTRPEPRDDGSGWEDIIASCPGCGVDLERWEPPRCNGCGCFVPDESENPCPSCRDDRSLNTGKTREEGGS